MSAAEQNVKENIMIAIFEVFEKMYYIFLEPSDFASASDLKRVVQIQFSGALNGEMHAYYSEALAEAMVENALSMEKEEITDQFIEDCLKESLNMICGNLLQKLEPDKVLKLSIPCYMGKAAVPQFVGTPESIHLAFESEGMTMDAVVKFMEPVK
jgi:CheY-specific phosphatase CheX